jgi:hypothetical protein
MDFDVTSAFHPAAIGGRPQLSRMSAGEATGGVMASAVELLSRLLSTAIKAALCIASILHE